MCTSLNSFSPFLSRFLPREITKILRQWGCWLECGVIYNTNVFTISFEFLHFSQLRFTHILWLVSRICYWHYTTHMYTKNVSMFSPPYRITSTQTRTSGEQVCTLFNLLLYYSFRQETEIVEKSFKCYEEKLSNWSSHIAIKTFTI